MLFVAKCLSTLPLKCSVQRARKNNSISSANGGTKSNIEMSAAVERPINNDVAVRGRIFSPCPGQTQSLRCGFPLPKTRSDGLNTENITAQISGGPCAPGMTQRGYGPEPGSTIRTHDLPHTASVVGMFWVTHRAPDAVKKSFGINGIVRVEGCFKVVAGGIGADLLGEATGNAGVGEGKSAFGNI